MNMHPSALLREAEDWLRYDPSTRQMLARIFLVRSDWCGDPLQKLDYLCKAIRLSSPSRLRTALINQACELADSGKITKDELLNSNPSYQQKVIRRGLLLKPRISDTEPGVLFISFEHEWARLLTIDDLETFSNDYRLVVAPSWSPPHSVLNYMFPRFYPGKVFNLISNSNDLDFFSQISFNYHPIELYASNWVKPDLFSPLPKESRDIDLLMVANFGSFKRHFVLFSALRKIPKINVVLVGQPHNGGTAASITDDAKLYGVDDHIIVRESVYGKELTDLFCRSKVSLVLSKREGSCVVVAESMFADTPVGLLEDAAIGSKAFINSDTGRLLSEKNLAQELTDFIEGHADYSPRQWALDNGISCHESTKTLNDTLKTFALNKGETWTEDIAPHHWRPDPTYEDCQINERLKPHCELIKTKYGIELAQ